MAPASTLPAKRYTISFQIRDGENEYYKDTTMDSDHKPMEEEQVKYVWERYSLYEESDRVVGADKAWKQYQDDGCLELDGDYRLIEDIGIEPDTRVADPELLEALKKANDFILSIPTETYTKLQNGYDHQPVLAALAKAEGRG